MAQNVCQKPVSHLGRLVRSQASRCGICGRRTATVTDLSPSTADFCGSGSVVSIATGYGLGGLGIKSRWRFSAPVQTDPGTHPTSCTMGTGSYPGGKERPGRDADPSPPSSAVVMKEQSYISTPSMGRTACAEPQCLYKGAL